RSLELSALMDAGKPALELFRIIKPPGDDNLALLVDIGPVFALQHPRQPFRKTSGLGKLRFDDDTARPVHVTKFLAYHNYREAFREVLRPFESRFDHEFPCLVNKSYARVGSPRHFATDECKPL